jgi:hypothetical protein
VEVIGVETRHGGGRLGVGESSPIWGGLVLLTFRSAMSISSRIGLLFRRGHEAST